MASKLRRSASPTASPKPVKYRLPPIIESGQVHIEIADDGRGLDGDRIRQKAVERGLGSPEAIARLSDDEVYRFILMPGFSTATKVTNVSGRGVGMDVVISSLSAIGGTIALQSPRARAPNSFCKFR